MHYFRKPVEGVWKEFKLGKDEVKALWDATVDFRIKILVKVKERMKELAAKNGVTFTEAEVLAVYNGCEDTYNDKAIDLISETVAKKLAEAVAKKA